MNAAPRYHQIDHVASSGVVVAQPLLLLLENGPAFSLVLADRASPEPDDGGVILEDCTQLRIEPTGLTSHRSFDRIMIMREPRHLFWVATPDELQSIFSQPSEDPYILLELSRSESKGFNAAIRENNFDWIFEAARLRFAQLPKFFSPSQTELQTPDNYASGNQKFSEYDHFL